MNFGNLCRGPVSIAIAILIILISSGAVDGDDHFWDHDVSHNGSQSDNNPSFWSLPLRERLAAAARIAKQLVIALREHKISLRTKLHNIYPHLREKIARLSENLEDCYDRSYGYYDDGPRRRVNNVNIFRHDIRSITKKIFRENTDVLSKEDVLQRVKAFVENLRILADQIIDCAEKPKEQRTRWGLTSVMLYSRDEFKARTGNRHLNDSSPNGNDQPRQTYSHQLNRRSITFPNSDPRCDPELKESDGELPESFSWKEEGFVSPVRNQGLCGSCYVFGAIYTLESAVMIKNNENEAKILSPQATLNCMDNGCGGGTIASPFSHFVEVGAALENKFPYQGEADQCEKIDPVVQAESYCFHSDLTNEQMKILLKRNGPATVAIDADHLQNYAGGSFNGECSDTQVSHAVTLVGWTEDDWIVKNSWGKDWGENGYFYLPEERCGVNLRFGQPLL